ncbi:hypothetical protein AMTRI_Chr05g65780 [Amborella trichopoda]
MRPHFKTLILIGEEPESVLSKTRRAEAGTIQDDTDQTVLLVPKILPFPENWKFLVFSHPFETSKNGLIPFFRNTYKFCLCTTCISITLSS